VMRGVAELAVRGAAGELYIGGMGVGRGYWKQPRLTADRFVPDGVGGLVGGRLYRSGDRVRQAADGGVEYLGRLDNQVKVRGHRIELGEIEASLNRHPAVLDSVVVASDDEPTGRRLNAYLISRAEAIPATSELRAWLKRTLPDYMIPAAFVWLAKFPLTPNGKMDRRALSSPLRVNAESPRAFEPGRNPTEEILVGIWRDLLGVDRVGIYDDFFELGGHSLLIAELGFRLRTALHVEVPLRSLYGISTIASLAALIKVNQEAADRSEQLSRALNRLQTMSPEQRKFLLEQKRRQRTSVLPPQGGTV